MPARPRHVVNGNDEMTPRAVEARLRELVANAAPGARVYFPRKRGPRLGYSWNGRHLRPTGLTLESQLHEIAHVLVAPPARRRLVEFGLGPDPYRPSNARPCIPREEADAEELAACTMQLVLARLLGLDEGAIRTEYSESPLTRARVGALRERYPEALPPACWRSVLDATPD